MPSVLIVSPHFPPVNAPDMHRARMLLPFLRENGWEAEVLAVSPDQVAAPVDPWLVAGLPADVPVHRVNALGLEWSQIPGLGTLGLRALPALAMAGDRLLAAAGFDLVYFSTTVFEVHILGSRWKRKFGVPFVMDYQDPWVNDYYAEHRDVVPPGGRLKYALASALHRWMEPRILRQCAGITSVSPEYPRQLARRYPWFRGIAQLVQGFPGAKRDFDRLQHTTMNSQKVRNGFNDGNLHWVYVGRGGADMAKAMRAIFMALRNHAPAKLKQRLKIHLLGTSYAAAGKGAKSLAPLATEFGVQHLVEEHPGRIPYSETLALLQQADALIVPGSDDAAYTASKIYPYLLAGKPLLAVFHERSTVTELIRRVRGAVCVTFSDDDTDAAVAARVAEQWLDQERYCDVLPLDENAFRPFTDRGCAAELTSFFRSCVLP